MFDAIAARRSIRKFKNTPVPRHIIEEIIKAGALAPSSKNRQPWHFVVTTGKAKEEALAAMEQGLHREAQQPFLPESAQYIAGAWNTLAIMRQAPVIIFVVNPLGLDLLTPQNAENRVFEICNAQSIGAAVENMSLAQLKTGWAACGFAIFILLTANCVHGLTAAVNLYQPLRLAMPVKHQCRAPVKILMILLNGAAENTVSRIIRLAFFIAILSLL